MVSFIKVSLQEISRVAADALRGLRVYSHLRSRSPDRRNAPPPGRAQNYIASTYLSITPAAIAEPI
ncbi:hypothetical protein, partial [Klebsiella grimontii]|uniref:hypothetical protein n=2 Tax=Klebsiella grimontii TaxID=2058152 RepID=UPI0011E40C7C